MCALFGGVNWNPHKFGGALGYTTATLEHLNTHMHPVYSGVGEHQVSVVWGWGVSGLLHWSKIDSAGFCSGTPFGALLGPCSVLWRRRGTVTVCSNGAKSRPRDFAQAPL